MNPSNQKQAIKQMASNGGLSTLRLGALAGQSCRKTAVQTKLGIYFEASSGVAKQLRVSVKTAKHFQSNFTKENEQAKARQPSRLQLSAGGSPGDSSPSSGPNAGRAAPPVSFRQQQAQTPLTCAAYFSVESMLSEALPIDSSRSR